MLRGVGRAMDQARIDGPFIKAEENKALGIAYTIKDVYVGEVAIRRSANAWWMNDQKVALIIEAMKEGHTVNTACLYAEISRAQWEYFNKIHPEFEAVIEMCEQYQLVRAMDTVNRNLNDPKMARWLLERRHPKFKTRLTLDDVLGRQIPSLITNLAFQDENETPEAIAAKLTQLAETILSENEARKRGLVVPNSKALSD